MGFHIMIAMRSRVAWLISRHSHHKATAPSRRRGSRCVAALLTVGVLIIVGCSTPSSTALSSLGRYTGTWYDPTQGLMLVVGSSGHATLRGSGSSCGKPGGQATCTDSWSIKFADRSDTTDLQGVVISNTGPYMNNEVGQPVTLKLTSKKGLIAMSSPIGDSAGLCKATKITKTGKCPRGKTTT
jgi:hypothetical protein